MLQRLEDIPVKNIVLHWQVFGDFDSLLFRIEHIVEESGKSFAVEWKVVVERSNTAVVERSGLGIDTAVVAVAAAAVIVLADTHTDSFSVALQANNFKGCLQLTHFPARWPPCAKVLDKKLAAWPWSLASGSSQISKMADVRERLDKRNEERLAAIERRKADKESNEQPTETIEYIKSTFAKEKGAIEEQLGKRAELIEAGNKMKAVEFFDCLSDKCQKLQKFLADSTMFLPSRDIQVSQDSLKVLQQEINEKREEYIPKKKFAFKARKKESSVKEVRTRSLNKKTVRKEKCCLLF